MCSPAPLVSAVVAANYCNSIANSKAAASIKQPEVELKDRNNYIYICINIAAVILLILYWIFSTTNS